MTAGPDFLCIGAPKCGTSWLHRQMSQHPQVQLPVVKELHYFDRRFPLPATGEKANSKDGLLGFFPGYPRDKILRTFGKALSSASLRDLIWSARYFGGQQDDAWYCSLFNRPAGIISGDFTTGYCALSDAGVAHVKELLPQARIVFLMRNPVERAWSHARMLVPKLLAKPLEAVSEDEFAAYLAHPAAQLRGRYIRTLDTWGAHFAPENMLTGFFEEIRGEPERLLQKIYRFLELDASPSNLPADIRRPVNVGNARVSKAIPPHIHALLRDLYKDDIVALSERIDGVADSWRAVETKPT